MIEGDCLCLDGDKETLKGPRAQWRPMWEYVVNACGEVLTEEGIKAGIDMVGSMSIPGSKAADIGRRILSLLETGAPEKYAEQREAYLRSLPDVPCLCNRPEYKPKRFYPCAFCDGKRSVSPWFHVYQFNTESLRAFAEFCLNCGDFRFRLTFLWAIDIADHMVASESLRRTLWEVSPSRSAEGSRV